ncbi:MAG: hypothetical protein ACNI3A_19335 [Desulfovibrio sp.]|uniref:hypothetical protein n=1 Tax=Desulfovibrio sp. 7SRBS1 TaxID=3378064 RepID=UPI003B40EA8C
MMTFAWMWRLTKRRGEQIAIVLMGWGIWGERNVREKMSENGMPCQRSVKTAAIIFRGALASAVAAYII